MAMLTFKKGGEELRILCSGDLGLSALMVEFYKQWLSGKSKQEAFRAAQRQVRAKYPDPFYWAAFVIMD
jgi:CHAT domain-containing protein